MYARAYETGKDPARAETWAVKVNARKSLFNPYCVNKPQSSGNIIFSALFLKSISGFSKLSASAPLKLCRIQFFVEAVLFQQFLVISLLDDVTVPHN